MFQTEKQFGSELGVARSEKKRREEEMEMVRAKYEVKGQQVQQQ